MDSHDSNKFFLFLCFHSFLLHFSPCWLGRWIWLRDLHWTQRHFTGAESINGRRKGSNHHSMAFCQRGFEFPVVMIHGNVRWVAQSRHGQLVSPWPSSVFPLSACRWCALPLAGRKVGKETASFFFRGARPSQSMRGGTGSLKLRIRPRESVRGGYQAMDRFV